MATQRFEVTEDWEGGHNSWKQGDVVYAARCPDYGLCRDDQSIFGVPFSFVSLNEDGSAPGRTIPTHLLVSAPYQ